MAGTIEYDVIGSRISAGENGAVWDRRFVIRGLENGPSIPALIDEAYLVVPDTGTPAPAPIVNMYVRDASLDNFWCVQDSSPQRWACNGSITYSTPTRAGGSGLIGVPDDNGIGIMISSVASVEEVETDQDRNGTQITTEYDNVTMAHLARTTRYGRTITYRRLESSSPLGRQTAHQGTLNNATWNGYGSETVLCQSIDWETDDQGFSYIVTYTFVVRPTWTFTAVHEDPFFPGHPLPGASGNARNVYDLYFTSNFGLLNITLPT